MTETPETPNTPEPAEHTPDIPTAATPAPESANTTAAQPTVPQPTVPQQSVPQPPAPLTGTPAAGTGSQSTAATVPLPPTAPPTTPPSAYAPPAPTYGVAPQQYSAPQQQGHPGQYPGQNHAGQNHAPYAGAAPYGSTPQNTAPHNPAPHLAGNGAGQQPPAAFTPDGAAKAPKGNGASFRRTSTAGVIAALAVAALVGGVAGAGVMLATGANQNSSSTPTSAGIDPTSITINDPDDATTITAVAAKAAASVVTISVKAGDSGGTGSGVVLSADGYILTNTHVVTLDGASADGTIEVQLNDGRLYSATVVGTDPISDLAVIKVKGATDLQPADFADSSKLNVGDTAIAIGAPLGLSGTVTDGIVSALNRSITIASSAVPESSGDDSSSSDTPLWGFDLPGQSNQSTSSTSTISLSVVQTDAAINPGNSGGALLNAQGEIIGINVAIASAGSTDASSQSGNIGVGFAIPANLAKRVSDEIIANGSATHGLLGASVADVTSADSDTVGASIKEVVSGGAAADAGIKAGDVITNFNGLPITGATDLTAQVRALAAGATAKVTYVRNGAASSVDVTLGELTQ